MSDTLAAAKSFSLSIPQRDRRCPRLRGSSSRCSPMRMWRCSVRNKIRARLRGEAPAFDFYYDGKTVSAFAPSTMAYSTSAAPATIDEMLPDLENETGIRFVTSPLFFSNPYQVLTKGLLSGIVVGPATIRGTACQHLAFRSPRVNWEESGSRPVPALCPCGWRPPSRTGQIFRGPYRVCRIGN